MSYVLTDENNNIVKYPYTIWDLKNDNPNTSFPYEITNNQLAEFNVYNVDIAPKPEYDESIKNCIEGNAPIYVNGVWTVEWLISDKTQYEIVQHQEKMMARNKEIAKKLLSDTDWASVPSVSNPDQSNPYLANQADFFAYRNQVRAIAIDPPAFDSVVWPDIPNAEWSK